MQISLTKKMSKAMGIHPGEACETANPLFCWTANWINTFSNRKEDMIVLVNHATRLTVVLYGIRRNQFKNIEIKIIAAISRTLLAMNLNPDLVKDYMHQAGETSFVVNRDPKMTACLNRQGLDAARVVGRALNESEREIKFIDTWGSIVSRSLVNYSKSPEAAFFPSDKMSDMLVELIGKPAYRYRAFELRASLDLDIYKAGRRLIVPADIVLQEFHEVLQKAFNWRSCHLYDFSVYDEESGELVVRLVSDEESLNYDNTAMLLYDRKLSDYLPGHKLVYTYDMGDNWEHQIEVMRVIEEHSEDSPFLLEAEEQSPPEDVGGVGGFIRFRTAMLDSEHPEHNSAKDWVRYWSPDLSEWEKRPRALWRT